MSLTVARLKNHLAQLGLPTAGLTEVLTVGRGQRFATVAHALDYIITNCPAPTQVLAGLGGTVNATQCESWLFSDTFAESLNHPPDPLPALYPIIEPLWIDIAAEGKLRLVSGIVNDGQNLVMATEYEGASSSTLAYALYRLPSYVIMVPPGNNVLSGQFDMSVIRANVAIIGQSKFNTRLDFLAVDSGVGAAIGFPTAGKVTLKNLNTIYAGAGNRPYGGAESAENGVSESMFGLSVTMENMVIESAEGLGNAKDAIGLLAAEISVRDMHVRTHGHTVVFHANSLIVDGLVLESKNIVGLQAAGFHSSDFQRSLPHVIRNVRYLNTYWEGGSSPVEIASVGAVHSSTLSKKVFIDHLAADYVTVSNRVDGSGGLICHLNGVQTGSLGIDNATVYCNDVRKPGGGAVPITRANGAVVARIEDTDQSAVVYSAATHTPANGGYTPDAAAGASVFVSSIAGALQINVPVGAVKGNRITFHYAADATPGRQITYNAVFKTSAVPASTANGKATHTFSFDGVHWVQDGGALAWL